MWFGRWAAGTVAGAGTVRSGACPAVCASTTSTGRSLRHSPTPRDGRAPSSCSSRLALRRCGGLIDQCVLPKDASHDVSSYGRWRRSRFVRTLRCRAPDNAPEHVSVRTPGALGWCGSEQRRRASPFMHLRPPGLLRGVTENDRDRNGLPRLADRWTETWCNELRWAGGVLRWCETSRRRTSSRRLCTALGVVSPQAHLVPGGRVASGVARSGSGRPWSGSRRRSSHRRRRRQHGRALPGEC